MIYKNFKMFEEESNILDTKQKVKEWLDSMNIENYTINDDLTVDVNTTTHLTDKTFKNIPVKFGTVKGYFYCSNCTNLVSIEGTPLKVSRSFSCSNCPRLVSLKGSPEEVGESFYCNGCSDLISLEGAPRKVDGDFSCNSCPRLTSLEGCPNKIHEDFSCRNCPNLVSLINFPQINGSLYHSNTPFEKLFNDTNFKDFAKMSDQEKENFIIEAFKENRIDERVFNANVSKEKQIAYKGLVSGKKFGL